MREACGKGFRHLMVGAGLRTVYHVIEATGKVGEGPTTMGENQRQMRNFIQDPRENQARHLPRQREH